jgi:DnaJ-class molecular chaperone
MNPYQVLEIERSATKEDIKKAYRKLALQHHPDRGGDENKFKEITQAHTILIDEEKRRIYDMTGRTDNTPQPGFPSGFNPFDLFGGMFRHPEQQSVKLPDKIVTVEIDLEEAIRGTTIDLNVTVEKRCECNKDCDLCKGSGQIGRIQAIGPFQQVLQVKCDKCSGTGIFAKGCSTCREQSNRIGSIYQHHSLHVLVPPKAFIGFQQVFQTLGSQSKRSGETSGDLVIQVQTKTHPHFTRRDNHLVYKIELSLLDSLIGNDRVIGYFNEDIVIPIKEWTPIDPRKEYHLKGYGMQNERGKIGDLIIIFNIDYQKLSPEVIILLQQQLIKLI